MENISFLIFIAFLRDLCIFSMKGSPPMTKAQGAFFLREVVGGVAFFRLVIINTAVPENRKFAFDAVLYFVAVGLVTALPFPENGPVAVIRNL